jgi:hypothetical protein
MGDMRNAYNILVGKPEGKRPLVRPMSRWEGSDTEADFYKHGTDPSGSIEGGEFLNELSGS